MASAKDRKKLRTRELKFLQESGFTSFEVKRLVAGRERFRRGEYTDETQETKRLLFMKWLYEHGRVGDVLVDDEHRIGEELSRQMEAA